MEKIRIITVEEAITQGSTPSELRVLANSLERLGDERVMFDYHHPNIIGNQNVVDQPAISNAKVAYENASELRRLAGKLQKVKAK